MPEYIYRVVEFTDEKTLAVIPTTWLDGNSCALWPPHDDAIRCRNACRRRDVPGDEWKSFPIKEWFATNDWDEANRKLRRLEDSSNAESTDIDNLGRTKRRKRLARRYSDSDSDSTTTSPTQQALPILPAPPVPPAPPAVTPKRLLSTIPRASASASSSQPSQQSHEMVRVSAIEPILHRIFKTLEEIKAEQRAVRRKIDKLREERPEPPSVNFTSLGDMFPLKTREEMNDMERKLQEAAFQSRVVWHLGAFNGRNITEGVRKMLEETLGHNLALTYNLSGKGKTGKRSFQQLLLYKAIFDAIRKRYPDVTDREYRSVLVNWFDGAKDRQGGRKRRAQDNASQDNASQDDVSQDDVSQDDVSQDDASDEGAN